MANVNLGSAYATLELRLDQLSRDIASAKAMFKGLENSGSNTASRIGSGFGRLRGVLSSIQGGAGQLGDAFGGIADRIQGAVVPWIKRLGAAGSLAFGSLLGFGLKFASSLQTTAAQMQALTGDTAKAQKLFKDIYNFVRGTPFPFPDVSKAAATLLGYGRTAQQVSKDIRVLGGLVAITGADWQRLSVVYGQVNAAGRLYAQDALQLIQNGVPITTAVAKQLGIGISEVKDKMADGAITADVFNKAMASLVPADAIERVSQTMPGALSNLIGSLRVFSFALLGIDYGKFKEGEPLLETQGSLFQYIRLQMLALSKAISSPEATNAMGKLGDSIVSVAKVAIPALIGGVTFLINNFDLVKVAVGAVAGAFLFARTAQAAFIAVSKANPLLLLVYAATALVGALSGIAVKSGLVGNLMKNWNNIVAALQPTLNLLGSILKDIANSVVSFLKPAIDALNVGLKGSGQSVDAWRQKLQPVNDAIRSVYFVLKDVVKIGIAGAVHGFKLLGQAFEILKPALKSVWELFKNLGSLFIDSKGQTTGWVKVIDGVLLTAVRALGAVIKYVADSLNWLLNAFKDGAKGTGPLAGAIKFLTPLFKGLFDTLANQLWPALQKLWQAIQPLIPILGKVLGFAITAIIAVMVVWWTILAKVITVIVQIATVIVNVLVVAFNAAMPVLQVLASVFAWVFNAIWTVVKVVFSAVKAVVLGVIKLIAAFIIAYIMVIKAVWTAVWTAIKVVFSAIWGAIKAVAVGFAKAVVGVVKWLVNAAITVWNGLKALIGFVGKVLGGVKDAVVKGFWAVVNWIKGFVGKFVKLGGDVIHGILDGLKNAGKAIVDFIKKLFGDVIGIAKKILHIGSPSKVFMGIGMDTMAGYIAGVTGQAGSVRKAIQGTIQTGLAAAAVDQASAVAAQISSGSVKTGESNVHTGDVINVEKVEMNGVNKPSEFLRELKLAKA